MNSYTRASDTGLIHDQRVWVADLHARTVVHDGGTSVYRTEFSNYDAYGNPGTVRESGPNGGVRNTTFTYVNDPARWILGRVASELNQGTLIRREFDGNGNLTMEMHDGVKVVYTYDSRATSRAARFHKVSIRGTGRYRSRRPACPSLRSSSSSPRARAAGAVPTISYAAYQHGIPRSEKLPEGIALTREVDGAGNVVAETDGTGATTRYTYDALNRLTSVTPPLGAPTAIQYTATSKRETRGRLSTLTSYDPSGARRRSTTAAS